MLSGGYGESYGDPYAIQQEERRLVAAASYLTGYPKRAALLAGVLFGNRVRVWGAMQIDTANVKWASRRLVYLNVNLHGSYRALLGNGLAALSAAIEIYNKPRIDYRDECTVILLINAWELTLKATLSKKRVRIYYPKRRNHPYRTYSISDALNKSMSFFPSSVDFEATAKNLELLVEYRDNAIHFYNEPSFGIILYSLAQTTLTNFRDFVKAIFSRDIADEITLSLIPLALATPVDPIQFLRTSTSLSASSKSVREFTLRLRDLIFDLEDNGRDTGRLLTVFQPYLVSTKKVAKADFTIGVQRSAGAGPPTLVDSPVDPNQSHPYREVDIITKSKKPGGLGLSVGGEPLTQYPFRALVYYLKAKENPKYRWADKTGAVTRYSEGYIHRLRKVTPDELKKALQAYKDRPSLRKT